MIFCNNGGNFGVEGAYRLAGLEERVGIVSGAANERMFGVERAGAVGADQFVRDQRPDVIVAQERQGIELVRGPEAVEEMQERHARLKRRRLRDQCRVMGFLYVRRRK